MAHADWTWVDLSIVLWSDESRFTPFQNDGWVFVRRPHEAYRNSCVVPILKFGGDGLTVWVAMLYIETGFLTPLNGNLNKKDGYLDILRNSAISSAHGITLFSKTMAPHATELMLSNSGNLTKDALSGMVTTES